MPQASVVTSSTAASRYAAPPFVCTWQAGGLDSAWVHVAGELDLATSPQLRQTLRAVQLHARMIVLGLRELTFMDTAGVGVILDAAEDARREGGRLILVHGPPQVDRMLTLTGVSEQVSIFDLDPPEPAPELPQSGKLTRDFLRIGSTLNRQIRSRWTAARAGAMQHAGLAGGFDPSPSSYSPVVHQAQGAKEVGMSGTQSDRLMAGSMCSAISNAVVRLLSEYTGRGPTEARTYMNEDLVTVVLHDTLTKEERSIVRDGSIDLVQVTREAFRKAMKPDLIAAVERLSGRSTISFMSESHIDPDIAIESFVLAPLAS